MTDPLAIEVKRLRQEVANLITHLAPWVATDEMCARYRCTPKTLANMERDGRLPFRTAGKWSRVKLMQWESKLE
jgi:hypothetical protein